MRKKQIMFGIRKKAIISISFVCGIIFLLTYLWVSRVVETNVAGLLTKQYYYLNNKLIETFGNIYKDLDNLTGDFVTNDYVQKTLRNRPMSKAESELMKKTLSYYNKSFLDAYLIVDNKENFYSLRKMDIDYDAFLQSELYHSLGTEYSKTIILWTRDEIFGTGEMSFFAIRALHEMNADHPPGMLVLKIKDNVLEPIRQVIEENELVYFIQDENGQTCYEIFPDDQQDRWRREYREAQKYQDEERLQKGIIRTKEDPDTGFTVVTFAPANVTEKIAGKIRAVMILIFILGYSMMLLLVVYLSTKLTNPIKQIQQSMCEFDDSRLDQKIAMQTNTELDYIGNAYNEMLDKVKNLMTDVQTKERELKESEMQTMLYQIHPHFLYNTLDTIYMLARIQKEETIMKVIQSLSVFLRINLSNGSDLITVEQEIRHVCAYMDIQKIRNAELFSYHVDVEEKMKDCHIAKMILQPVVENCIKYGFRDIYEGGQILIRGYESEETLCFEVINNGTLIADHEIERLNQYEKTELKQMDEEIKGKKGGFGIVNVVKRLRMLYDGQMSFQYGIRDGRTVCTIKIGKECLEY